VGRVTSGPTGTTLAFTARGTSSFPGAFPPLSVTDYESAFDELRLDGIFDERFPLHRLSGEDPRDTYFIDGCVLDNFPFDAAIRAIKAKPAWTQVDRRLVFIEPDPGTDAAEGHSQVDRAPREPSWYATVWGGYAAIPGRSRSPTT
jgi:hypothetical protein